MERIMKKNCPKCNVEIIYKHRVSFWKSKKDNKPCVKCTRKEVTNRPEEKKKNSERQKGKRMGSENHFYGKKHTDETKNTISEKITKISGGENNPMFGRTFYEIWIVKYGLEEANIKLENFKQKQRINQTGKFNNMFGRPSPMGSGNGWSGWYKGWYFRSLIELSYMIAIIERYNFSWKSGETLHIPYIDFNGTERTYSPDFILNNKYVIECKPKSLMKSKNVILKSKAARVFCDENGLKFKITSIPKISSNILKEMFQNEEIQFIKRYEERVKKYFESI